MGGLIREIRKKGERDKKERLVIRKRRIRLQNHCKINRRMLKRRSEDNNEKNTEEMEDFGGETMFQKGELLEEEFEPKFFVIFL